MVTSLINFPDRQKLSALREMSREKVKVMHFYQFCFGKDYYWVSRFVPNEKEEQEEQEEEEDEELEMAGVQVPVMGVQVEPREIDPMGPEYYIDRVTEPFDDDDAWTVLDQCI